MGLKGATVFGKHDDGEPNEVRQTPGELALPEQAPERTE
jgi:hypothetical protein